MKVAIMQPTYIPWIGYFDLINRVDTFVFLDDVQFEKRSWQNRNRILHNGDYFFLTIPVKAASQVTSIIDIEIDQSTNWQRKHIMTIERSYAKCPFTKEMVDSLAKVIHHQNTKLVDINIPLIMIISEKIGLTTEFLLSSELKTEGKRSEKLVNILKRLNCLEYLSPNGSRDYIEEEGVFKNAHINVEYQNYVPQSYTQRNVQKFIPYLSIVDLIANIGFQEAYKYI
jgi:hypothetical protein